MRHDRARIRPRSCDDRATIVRRSWFFVRRNPLSDLYMLSWTVQMCRRDAPRSQRITIVRGSMMKSRRRSNVCGASMCHQMSSHLCIFLADVLISDHVDSGPRDCSRRWGDRMLATRPRHLQGKNRVGT